MTQCIDINCWYHKEYGNNKICPITKEVHEIGQRQKRNSELKRLEKCFKIIEHEIIISHKLILLEKLNSLKKHLN